MTKMVEVVNISKQHPTYILNEKLAMNNLCEKSMTSLFGVDQKLVQTLWRVCEKTEWNLRDVETWVVTTSLRWQWVVSAPAVLLRCGSVSPAPSFESNFDSPLRRW